MINYITSEMYRVVHQKSFYIINFLGILFILGIEALQDNDDFESYFYGLLFFSMLIMPIVLILMMRKNRDVERLITSYSFKKGFLVLGDFFAANTIMAFMFLFYLLFLLALGYTLFGFRGGFNYVAATIVTYVLCICVNAVIVSIKYITNTSVAITLTFLFMVGFAYLGDAGMLNGNIMRLIFHYYPVSVHDRLIGYNLPFWTNFNNLFITLVTYCGIFLPLGIFVYGNKNN